MNIKITEIEPVILILDGITFYNVKINFNNTENFKISTESSIQIKENIGFNGRISKDKIKERRTREFIYAKRYSINFESEFKKGKWRLLEQKGRILTSEDASRCLWIGVFANCIFIYPTVGHNSYQANFYLMHRINC